MGKNIRAAIIRPDGEVEEVQIRRSDWLQQASNLLDGAYIAPTNNIGGEMAFLCDEDGQAKELPPNQKATYLVTAVAGRRAALLLGSIIFTGVLKNGYPTDLPEGLINHEGE